MRQREVFKGKLNGNPNGFVESVHPTYDGVKKFPVLFWLNGLGETGDGGDKALDKINRNIVQWLSVSDEHFLVIAPQDPTGYGKMTPFIRWALQHYAPVIDRGSMHLAGLSAGGYQIADMINEDPEFLKDFSTITPMGTNFDRVTKEAIQRLADYGIAFWGHAGEKDGDPNAPGALARFFAKLQAISKKPALLSVYAGMGHSAWNETFDGSGKPAREIPADTLQGAQLFKWVDKPASWWQWMLDNAKGGAEQPEEPEEPGEIKLPVRDAYYDLKAEAMVFTFDSGKFIMPGKLS